MFTKQFGWTPGLFAQYVWLAVVLVGIALYLGWPVGDTRVNIAAAVATVPVTLTSGVGRMAFARVFGTTDTSTFLGLTLSALTFLYGAVAIAWLA